MSEHVSVSEMHDRIVHLQSLQLLRCAQALRSIRDTTTGYASTAARRALEEAQIPDPDEDPYYWDQEIIDG